MSRLPTETGVLIVGAGPTGLALGLALRARGVECMIIDQMPAPLPWSRALGLQPRTLEILEALDVLEQVRGESLALRAVHVYGEHDLLFRLDMELLNVPGASVLVCPQTRFEELLAERFRAAGGLLVRGCELVSLTQGQTGVQARLRWAEAEQVLQCAFLVGCDGARSRTRELLGLRFEGVEYPDHFLLADLDIDWDLEGHASHGFLLGSGVLIAIPMPEGWRLIINQGGDQPPRPGEEQDLTPFRQRLEQCPCDVRGLGEPRWISRFSVHRRLADHFRRNRVFLAGDAAHVQSPMGAQGMNTGIGDAFNLGWKLALYLQGCGDGRLLDSYEQERRPVARQMLTSVDMLSRGTLARSRPVRYVRDRLLRFAGRYAEPGRRLLRRASQLDIQYRGSPLTGQAGPVARRRDGPCPGDRMPDARLEALASRASARLHQWLRPGRFVLVVQLDEKAREHGNVLAVHALANRLDQDHGGEVLMEVVIPEQLPQEYRDLAAGDFPGLWRDRHGDFRAHCGASDQLWLLRPDGHLAWRGPPGEADRLLEWLDDWLRRR